MWSNDQLSGTSILDFGYAWKERNGVAGVWEETMMIMMAETWTRFDDSTMHSNCSSS